MKSIVRIVFVLWSFFNFSHGRTWNYLKSNICLIGTNPCTSKDLLTLRAVLYANGEEYSFTLDEAGAIDALNNPAFVSTYQTVIYGYGYLSTVNSDSAIIVKDAYVSYGNNTNFFMLFTDQVFSGILINVFDYIAASQKTVCVGERLGNFLVELFQGGVSQDNMHLIGHSIGAHVMHTACQRFISSTGYKIHRATGLDAAGPCFDPNSQIQLNANDANLVDIFHTSEFPIGFGTFTRLGQANVIFNNGAFQEGCFIDISCSHERAYRYYAESMKSDLCIAAPAASKKQFKFRYLHNLNTDSFPVGYKWNGQPGMLYLKTNSQELFCKGNAGINKNK